MAGPSPPPDPMRGEVVVRRRHDGILPSARFGGRGDDDPAVARGGRRRAAMGWRRPASDLAVWRRLPLGSGDLEVGPHGWRCGAAKTVGVEVGLPAVGATASAAGGSISSPPPPPPPLFVICSYSCEMRSCSCGSSFVAMRNGARSVESM